MASAPSTAQPCLFCLVCPRTTHGLDSPWCHPADKPVPRPLALCLPTWLLPQTCSGTSQTLTGNGSAGTLSDTPRSYSQQVTSTPCLHSQPLCYSTHWTLVTSQGMSEWLEATPSSRTSAQSSPGHLASLGLLMETWLSGDSTEA